LAHIRKEAAMSDRDGGETVLHLVPEPEASEPSGVGVIEVATEGLDSAAADASKPDVLDRQAEARDAAATARDQQAVAREASHQAGLDFATLEADQLLASRDREAAALDRREAALDRNRAAAYLKRSYRDQLTGLLQRAAGLDLVSREVDRAHRAGEQLVIAFLDVVGLKHTNDTYGHVAGDRVLHAVGASLREGLRSYDVAVRWGGDEFVCALPGSTLATAGRRFDDVQALLTAACSGAVLTVGMADLGPDESMQDAIDRADRDLYDRRHTPH
jgi:diguanylate cyclase (GGDEF)-like protein